MRVFTYHRPLFSLRTKGTTLDPSKSAWVDRFDPPGIYLKRYAELSALVGTTQFLWCVPNANHSIWIDHNEWTIEIPESGILKVLNSTVWCRLINDMTYPHLKWQAAARKMYPSNIQHQDAHYDSLKAEWEKEKSESDLWSNIFNDRIDDNSTVLIGYPVLEIHIVDVKPCPYRAHGPKLI